MNQGKPLQTQNKRKKLIQLIHIGKQKLNLTEDAYRALLDGVCGKESCSKMTMKELEQTLKAIKSGGFVVKSNRANGFGKATPAQIEELKRTWQAKARVKTEEAMNRFGKRITGVDSYGFYTVKDIQKVIIAAKAMH